MLTQYYFNVRVDNVTLQNALRRVERFVDRSSDHKKCVKKIFFTNVHSIHLSRKDPDLQHTINEADLVLPDGSGLMMAGKLMGNPVTENLNGTDFMPKVCRIAEKKGWSMYLLGAQNSVVKKCYENMQKQYPQLSLKGYHHGFFDKEEEKEVLAEINEAKPDILMVAMGSPIQEKWISAHASEFDEGVWFAVGGLFDFLSKEKERAPQWMRKMGIEWLYRFLQDPSDKWKRIFIEIPVFLGMIFTKSKLIPKNW